MSTSAGAGQESPGHLRRSLSLWDLVFYGIIMIQPTAPMPIFGIVGQEAKGHVATTVLIAMAAMLLTAISYGRMARVYPSAGSVYTYVSREIHPAFGFITGWSVTMDYMINPVICTIWCAKAAVNFAPATPYAAWAILFALLFTTLNLRGIQATARVSQALVLLMTLVIVVFLVAAARYVSGLSGLTPGFFARPFYDPSTFSFRAIATGTSIAVLTYLGFDQISTLSEEARNPRRNILLATVLTCLITGIFSVVQVYAGQLVWPEFAKFPDVDTAFSYVAGRAGGPVLFHVMNLTLLVASVGSGMGAQLAAVRLLYGMGRDNAIPRRFFAQIDAKRGVPRNNVLFTGAIILSGAFLVSYQLGAELLNFGAFIAFMGVNASAFAYHFFHERNRSFFNLAPPILGFLICAAIWLSLRLPVLIAGGAWVLLGLIYGAIKTNGFRRNMTFSEVPE